MYAPQDPVEVRRQRHPAELMVCRSDQHWDRDDVQEGRRPHPPFLVDCLNPVAL